MGFDFNIDFQSKIWPAKLDKEIFGKIELFGISSVLTLSCYQTIIMTGSEIPVMKHFHSRALWQYVKYSLLDMNMIWNKLFLSVKKSLKTQVETN